MKQLDEKIIPTISVDDVDYMVCEHYADSIKPLAKFKLYPNKDSAKMKVKISKTLLLLGVSI